MTEVGKPSLDPVLVDRCLEKICASPEFFRSERMITFLRCVVNASLEGRHNQLTERYVGRTVFGKPVDWDPSVDTIVRSEARRLRSKLQLYYENYGQQDQLAIRIPKGGYAPDFDIKPVLVTEQIPTGADASPGRFANRSLLVALSSIVLLSLIVIVVWSMLRRGSDRSAEQKPFHVTPFTSEIGREFSPAISPDGSTVAYVWDNDEAGPDLYLRAVENGAPHRLDTTAAVRLFPAWSPDGSQIAFLQVEGDGVEVVTHVIRDSSEQRITRITKQIGQWADDNSPLLGAPGPAWTSDGKSLIVADYDPVHATGGIFLTDLSGHRTMLTRTRGEDRDLYPRLSPDGKTLAYVRYSSHGVGELMVQPLTAAADQKALTFDKKAVQGLAWLPDGHHLLFASNRSGSFQLWTVATSGNDLTMISTNSSSAAEPALSPSGNWLIYVESHVNWNIWRQPIDGGLHSEVQRLLSSSGKNYDPRYSPDGNHIAFASDRSGSMELWLSESDGKQAKQLTHLDSTWLGGINWSPTGEQIAFDARPHQHSAIFLIPASGGEPKLLDRNTYEERMPSWSLDSQSIYFNSNRDGTLAVWKRSLMDGSTQRISPPGIFAVTATKEGLVYSSRTGEMWRSGPDGENATLLMGGLRSDPVMSWFSDGQTLFLSRFDERARDFSFLRYKAGRMEVLGLSKGMLVPNAPDIAVSPDGHWLLYAKQDSSQSDLRIRRE
jgi:Tol biopolymer transport system component